MRVKKYVAESIVEALTEIKKDLGPEAIILSTKEEKRIYGQPQKYTVVAAVKDQDLKAKEITQRKLGHYAADFAGKSAAQQKAIVGTVVEGLKRKQQEKLPDFSNRRYIEIEDHTEEPVPTAAMLPSTPGPTAKSTRVSTAVKEALHTSLRSHLFSFGSQKTEEPQEKVIEVAEFQKIPARIPIGKATESPDLQGMKMKLLKTGIDEKVVDTYIESAKKALAGQINRATLEAYVAKRILDEVRCVTPNQFSGIEFFVGPEGAGKTSSIVKLASQYIINERRRVAIVTTDLKKVGALEQLKVYSRILNVPVIPVASIEDWQELVHHLGEYDNVLVDTPGISLSQASEFEFLRSLTHIHGGNHTTTHMVLSAMSSTRDTLAFAERFKVARYKDVIFTKIDQTTQHGILLNFFMQTKVPFHSFGLSSDIIDGFEWATRERILDLIFRLTKLNGAKSYGQQL